MTRTTVDAYGNIFLVGVYGRDYGVFGLDTLFHNSVDDHIYVARINSEGEFLWSCDVGGVEDGSNNKVFIESCPIDSTAFVYFSTSGPEQLYCDSMLAQNGLPIIPSTYLAKISSDGTVIWIRPMGTNISATTLAVTPNGDIYTTVRNSSGQSLSFGGVMIESGYSLVRIDGNSGECIWNSHFSDEFLSVSQISFYNGLIWLSGNNINYPVCTIDTIPWTAQYRDMYLCTFDTLGHVQWLQSFGGDGEDRGRTVVSSDGLIYSIGMFKGQSQFGEFNLDNDGKKDWFAARHDSDGNIVWIQQAHATDSVFYSLLTTDADSNLLCIGTFTGSITIGGQTVTSESDFPFTDVFIVKCSPQGDCVVVKTIPAGVYYTYDQSAYSIASLSPTECFVHSVYYKDSLEFDGTYLESPEHDAIFVAKLSLLTEVQSRESGSGELIIYANPTTGLCNVSVPEEFLTEPSLVLRVMDSQGRTVEEEILNMRQPRIKIDLRAYATGIYTATLSNGRKVYSGRIVFQ